MGRVKGRGDEVQTSWPVLAVSLGRKELRRQVRVLFSEDGVQGFLFICRDVDCVRRYDCSCRPVNKANSTSSQVDGRKF